MVGQWLQWGHCANAVERWPRSFTRCATSTLQWGHCANAVERTLNELVRFCSLASMGPLRERSGEGPSSVSKKRLAVGFNGATARTQWRGCMDGVIHERITASMGPLRER